jgi:hypothetical protein
MALSAWKGTGPNTVAWVNSALVDRTIRDRHLQALAVAIVAYEESHGEITEDEMTAQARRDREAAEVVRGQGRSVRVGKRTRKGAA